jgi:tagatose-1,6-bisphosphate aldolase
MLADLSSWTTLKGHIVIAAFDHRDSLKKMLNPLNADDVTDNQLVELKRLFLRAFADVSSAVLIDPIYGLDYDLDLNSLVPRTTGVFFSLEESGYTDNPDGRGTTLLENWGVESIAERKAGAKLLLYYHPDAPNASEQLALVKTISDQTRNAGIPFLIEPIIYGEGTFSSKSKIEATYQTIEQLTPLVDILKLEFPMDVTTSKPPEWVSVAQAINARATVPWILLSRGMDYDYFRQLTEIAGEQGASGIAVGRAVWKEIEEIAAHHPQPSSQHEKIEEFLKTTGRHRMEELGEIVAQMARPWTAFKQ